MEQKVAFEMLLDQHRIVVERYINFRLPSRFDADDVIQETYCAAYLGYEKLRRKDLFKPWILAIAKNQCNLWFRKKYGSDVISLDTVPDMADSIVPDDDSVWDILSRLPRESAQLLQLTIQGYNHGLEFVAGVDEDIRIAAGGGQGGAVACGQCFQHAHAGGAHGYHAFCSGYGIGRFLRHYEALAVHVVVGHILHLHRAEGAHAHMQGHEAVR